MVVLLVVVPVPHGALPSGKEAKRVCATVCCVDSEVTVS